MSCVVPVTTRGLAEREMWATCCSSLSYRSDKRAPRSLHRGFRLSILGQRDPVRVAASCDRSRRIDSRKPALSIPTVTSLGVQQRQRYGRGGRGSYGYAGTASVRSCPVPMLSPSRDASLCSPDTIHAPSLASLRDSRRSRRGSSPVFSRDSVRTTSDGACVHSQDERPDRRVRRRVAAPCWRLDASARLLSARSSDGIVRGRSGQCFFRIRDSRSSSYTSIILGEECR